MKSKSRKDEILDMVSNHTLQCIQFQDFDNLGIDANSIAQKIHIDRSNVSRLLNQLNKDHILTKLYGKPMLFFTNAMIAEHFNLKEFPSILKDRSDLLALSSTKPMLKSDHRVDYIGAEINESLHSFFKHAYSSITYPNGGLNILITGEKHTGKTEIGKILLNQYLSDNNIKTTQYEIINCYNFNIEKLRYHLLVDTDLEKCKIIVLLNLDYLVDMNASHIQTILSEAMSIHTKNQSKRLILATSNSTGNNIQLPILKSIFPTIIEIPNFNSKTIKEKMEFLFLYIEEESNRINLPISIDKEIANCFVTSEYKTNIQNFKNEIKYTLANAVYRARNENNHLVKLSYDDLSDEVLNNITGITSKYDAVNNIHLFLDETNLLFIPKTKNTYYEKLHHASLNDSSTISIQNSNLLLMDVFCDEEIQKSQTIKINTARVMFAKEIYDLLYSEIKDTALVSNENIIFSLFIHLSHLVDSLKDNRYTHIYNETSNTKISVKIKKIMSAMVGILETTYKITIPPIEKKYISIYLQRGENFVINQKVSILILSYGENIATEFAKYANSLTRKTKIDSLNYSKALQHQPFQVFQDMINHKVKLIDNGYGVLVLSDLEPLTNLDRTIYAQTQIKTLTIAPISLPILLKTLNHLDNHITSLDEIKNLFQEKSTNPCDEKDLHPTKENDLLNNIYKHILKDSLIFLDFKKAKSLLYNSLMRILEELDLESSKEIITKYIIHCCFTIERSIRNEPLKTKKTNYFVKENLHLYHVVEKNFEIIEKTFGVTISKSEFILICQMFIEYERP